MSARFRFSRAGVLNVWQYDEQVFDFADGRLLLRGANGAGKSKTMEMLLPFVLDGDQTRLTASGRHHTSLVWLLLDGYSGGARTGYLWVEFIRDTDDGGTETLTCGVGLRATAAARQASTWFFTTPRRVGEDLLLDSETGPLGQGALAAVFAQDDDGSQIFDSGRRYREHVGQHLFGLPVDQYEALLRLIYWLRRPQVGEDIDPKKLASQLVNALPFVDPDTLAAAGSTFDDLQAHGEEIDRQAQSVEALSKFLVTYAAYARSVVAARGQAALSASKQVRDARRAVRQAETELADADADLTATRDAKRAAQARAAEAQERITALEASPEARSRASLEELRARVETLEQVEHAADADVRRAAQRAEVSARSATDAGRRVESTLVDLRTVTTNAHSGLHETGSAPDAVPSALALLVAGDWTSDLDVDAYAAQVSTATQAHGHWISHSRNQIGQRLAAVTLVAEALTASETAAAKAQDAQREADRCESAVEQARAASEQAAQASRDAEQQYADAFAAWRDDTPGIELPELTELTAQALEELPALVEQAVTPQRRELAEQAASATLRQQEAATGIAELGKKRQQIEAEVDPTPSAPLWHRDARADLAGAPLWQSVDFRPELDEAQRAGLEAALEGAGLLDGWITPDGSVWDAARNDVRLSVSAPALDGEDLSTWLVASPPPGRGLETPVIEAVLARIGVVRDDSTGEVAVSPDGRWVAGPARGRTTKPVAQFIGATAREQERRRRLAEIDAEIDALQQRHDQAVRDLAAATEASGRLATWVAARPKHGNLLGAWSRESTLAEATARAEAELNTALVAARTAREQAGAAHAELSRLGELHTVPITAEGIAARRERLTDVQSTIGDSERAATTLTQAVRDWSGHAQRARDDRAEQSACTQRQEQAALQARSVRARYDELASAAGAAIAELEQRLTDQRAQRAAAQADHERHSSRQEHLLEQVGSRKVRVEERRNSLAVAEPLLEQAYDAFTALHSVTGLIEAAQVGVDVDVPPTDQAQVRRMTEAAAAGDHASANDLLQALSVVQSGPASVIEPRLIDVDSAMAAVGRGELGDQSLPELADQLAARVEADRALLTERERELFETHVLGQLGDALRAVRRQAEELVAAMNGQLQSVTTSQGIRVRLQWRLRDDIPADARRAVKLLGQPSGALLVQEREELRNALHRLIDISRSETPEDSYTEHLARALDYREWFSFTVQYLRPETGDWRDLQSRSALSQGEQKVLCYLPLFAAAAAHFTSLAGAAPYAPRFVLLDDAFPKIDARTHPLLFGLLVDLDLDFVVTSERLWGTHATVPALAVYEALRNPSQRGIAQFEHRWDGHQLTAVGVNG